MSLPPDSTDDSEWLARLLQRQPFNVSKAAAAAAVEEVAPPQGVDAFRALQQSREWAPWLASLVAATEKHVSESVADDDDREELAKALHHHIDLQLEKLSKVAEAYEQQQQQHSAKEVELQQPTADEERYRTTQWCSTQPCVISKYVRRVMPPKEGDSHPIVECTCGHQCRSNHFRAHVISKAHADEFFSDVLHSEALAASAAVQQVAGMVQELGRRAEGEQLAAEALRAEVGALHTRITSMAAALDEQTRAACAYECRANRAEDTLRSVHTRLRSFTSPTALLHQQLWNEGKFDDPLNAALDEMHRHALVRIKLGDDVKRGGAELHLSPSAHAFALRMYNNCSASGYRHFRAVLRWPPVHDDIRKAVDRPFSKGGPFMALGCYQAEWGQQAYRLFNSAGFDPRTRPFGLCFDPVKMMSQITWDPKTNGFVGQLDFDSDLRFNSWNDMVRFLQTKVGAGYMIPFLLCSLDPEFPSMFVPVGMLPSDLQYTAMDVDSWLTQIMGGLTAAGFGHVVPTTAADFAAVHAKHLMLSGNPRAFAGDRAPGGGISEALLEGEDAILTLGAFRRKAATIETVVVVDPTHGAKNGSLQPLHLARLLVWGNFVLLTMMLVAVREAAGLHASDVNGSDPMDVGAMERRVNVATRRELAKDPESFGLLVYYFAVASMRAAWFDRDPLTTPVMRCRWAFDCLVLMRWWLDWIEVSDLPSATYFISMQTHGAIVLLCQMIINLTLLWGRNFRDKPFAPWLVGSDQNEKFNNEMRSFRLNQPDWTCADVLRLAQRWVHELFVMSNPDVHLPTSFSKRGYSRSSYVPSPTGEHIHTEWPTAAELPSEYAEAVERMRPLIVALGAAEDLRAAGRWHAPSLEEWESIEKAIDAEEAATEAAKAKTTQGERQRHGDDESESEREEEEEEEEEEKEEEEEESEVEEVEEAEEAKAATEHFPEKILKDHLAPGQRASKREYLMKWRGWSSALEDLTWQSEEGLVADGHAPLVLAYLLAEHRKGRHLTISDALRQAAEEEAGEEMEEEGAMAGEEERPAPPQPPIVLPDMAALRQMLTAPIGSEVPNGIHSKPLKPGASEAQRKAYEATHVTNEATGQTCHKRAVAAHLQKVAVDAKPGAGRTRYVTGERQPVISEDATGDGFACGKVYQIHLNEDGTPLNGGSTLTLGGTLRVGHVRLLELRKLNGKRRVLRLSVKAAHASVCSAVVLPLVDRTDELRQQALARWRRRSDLFGSDSEEDDELVDVISAGQCWVTDSRLASAFLVPLLSLGRCVEATYNSGIITLADAPSAAGGALLRLTCLSDDLFEASAMQQVSKDLMAMKVTDLKDELEARGEAKSGNKAWLRRRLHAAIVRDHLEECAPPSPSSPPSSDDSTSDESSSGEEQRDTGDEETGSDVDMSV